GSGRHAVRRPPRRRPILAGRGGNRRGSIVPRRSGAPAPVRRARAGAATRKGTIEKRLRRRRGRGNTFFVRGGIRMPARGTYFRPELEMLERRERRELPSTLIHRRATRTASRRQVPLDHL